MCKLITVNKTKEADNSLIEKILYSQIEALCAEPDGAGMMAINFDNSFKVERSYLNYDIVMKKVFEELPDSKFIGIHTRTGTKGAKDITNVHFFNNGSLYMAHNGIMSQTYYYGNYNDDDSSFSSEFNTWDTQKHAYVNREGLTKKEKKKKEKQRKFIFSKMEKAEQRELTEEEEAKIIEELYKQEEEEAKKTGNKKPSEISKFSDPSDTLEFLMGLPQEIDDELLRDKCSKEFNGKAVIVDIKEKKIWHFATMAYYAITDKKTFFITFSYKPIDLSIAKSTNLFGWSIREKGEKIDVEVIDVDKGVYCYKY